MDMIQNYDYFYFTNIQEITHKYNTLHQITIMNHPSPISSLSSNQSQNQGPAFREYNYRFVICILFSLLSFVNGMCWVVITPISVTIQDVYNVPSYIVTFIPMSYLILYLFINFPSNWVLDTKGIKKGIVAGALFTFLGCGIRTFVQIDFSFVVIGQVFCAIGQPFILNGAMKISTRWFMPKNRSLAFSILSVVNIIGTSVGFLIPPLFVTSNTNSQVKDQFFYLLTFELILAAFAVFFIILFFRQNPPKLPGLGAMIENTNFRESIGILFTHKQFISLAIAFGIVNGCFNIYGSLMDDILDPYGYNSDEVSYYGIGLMVTGIISAALIGAYVEKSLNFKGSFRVCGAIGILTTIAFPLGIKLLGYNFLFFLFVVIFQGMVFIPLQPLSADYACDIMFPIGQAQISGFLMTSGQFIGIIFIVVSQYIFDLGKPQTTISQKKEASFKSVLFCNSFLLLACLILMFQKGELKRSNLEYSKKEGEQSLITNTFHSFTESKRESKQKSILNERTSFS